MKDTVSDLEISKKLALAIGWEEDQLSVHDGRLYAAEWPKRESRWMLKRHYLPPLQPWKKFSYLDPAIIWPVAERFGCFPEQQPPEFKLWTAWMYTESRGGVEVVAETAAKAVALVVIKHHSGESS